MQALLTLPLSSDSPCQTVPPSVRSSWPALALIPGADWPHACRPASPCLGPDTIGQGTSLWGCPPHHSGRQATVHAQTTSSSCSDSDSPHQAVPLKTLSSPLLLFFSIYKRLRATGKEVEWWKLRVDQMSQFSKKGKKVGSCHPSNSRRSSNNSLYLLSTNHMPSIVCVSPSLILSTSKGFYYFLFTNEGTEALKG